MHTVLSTILCQLSFVFAGVLCGILQYLAIISLKLLRKNQAIYPGAIYLAIDVLIPTQNFHDIRAVYLTQVH